MTVPRRRVLIVDDEASIATLLAECLRGGYAVEVVANGADALAAVARARPDLMLLDMNMPGMSGLEVLRTLRTTEPDLPVIMITATADDAAVADALVAGAFSYIPKPFNTKYVDHLVVAALTTPKNRRPG